MVYSGLIAKYNLENWYEKTFSSAEKNIIESIFQPIFLKTDYDTPYSVSTELVLSISDFNCFMKKDGTFYKNTMTYWNIIESARLKLHLSNMLIFIRNCNTIEDKQVHLLLSIYTKISKLAYDKSCLITDDNELFLFLQIILDHRSNSYIKHEDRRLEFCNKQVEISEYIANRLISDNKIMPKNNAYEILYQKNQIFSNWKHCLKIAKKALAEGWEGQWKNKIKNCEHIIYTEEQSNAKKNEAIKKHDIQTLLTLAEQDNDIYKDIVQNFEIEEWPDEFNTIVKNDDTLLDQYCKKVYPDIIAKNPSLFIHLALGSLKYPKVMKSWIEFLYFTDESTSCNILDIENPMDTIKSYQCYVGVIINTDEKIYAYLETVKQAFPENEIKVHSKNSREVLIKVTSKDIVFKEKINNPWCHYYAEFSKYLNKVGYNIGLSEIIMNSIANDSQDFGQFDFVKISKDFQNRFDKLISMTEKSYFNKELITYDRSFVKPAKYTKADIKEYLTKNADKLLTGSWHTLTYNFGSTSSECFFDNLPTECDFNIFELFDFTTLNKDFSNEYRIKNILLDKIEQQGIIYITLKLKTNAKISDYLQSATTLFQNHEVFYNSESSSIYISIEKDDFVIQLLTPELIESMIDDSADIIEDIKKRNAKLKYIDEYIDLKSCSEYIFSCALNYIITSFKAKYYMKLKEFIALIKDEDLIKEVNLNIQEIYYKTDFNTDTNFLAYVSMLRDKFVKSFYSICQEYGKYFFIALWEKDYWHIESYISSPFDNYAEPYQKINLLYNLKETKEDFGGDGDITFIPELDTFIKRDDYPKYQWVFKFGINLDYIHFEEIQTVSDKIFSNNVVYIKRNTGIAIVEIHLDFSDFDLIEDENILEKSFLKHLEFIKLAYCTNLQCKKKEHLEYISDELLLETIAYNESRYLFTIKKEFCDKLEDFFYAIGREKFVEKYKYDKG